MSFCLKKLVINEGCKYLKALRADTYEFLDDNSINNFYGKNIEVSAIVGKNGSGKSSLLEVIFRMMNNLSVFISHGCDVMHRVNTVFVAGLNSDLYYTINGVDCHLACRNRSLALTYGNKKWKFGNANDEFTDYKDGNSMSTKDKIEMCKNLFFTLISNYSIQAYVDADYSDEETYTLNKKGTLNDTPSGKTWIHYVFHKNDGYMAPININPFRDNGKLDMLKEETLQRQRMEFLMLHYDKENKEFIRDYKLSRIEYRFDWKKMYYKFSRLAVGPDIEEANRNEWIMIVNDFKKALCKRSIAKTILNEAGINSFDLDNNMLVYAYLYVVYKVLSISCTYPSYSNFSIIANVDLALRPGSPKQRRDALFLAKEVFKDHSHITNKVYQALNFIKMINKGFVCNEDNSFTWSKYNEYHIKDDLNKPVAIENEIRSLPPSFFDYKIYLKQNGTDEELPIEHMSAGERQLYYILSTLIYHILNLKSVNTYRIHYRDVLVVLDEVELGFHPDYQRKFINFMIETFERLHLQSYVRFHFLMTTHSPFMLSDVLNSNVIYLEKGHKKYKEKLMNPFCANINEILAQNFFLSEGFVGEFAKNKILDLLNWLDKNIKNNQVWNITKAEALIDALGEPIIKQHLEHMLEHKKRIINEENRNK